MRSNMRICECGYPRFIDAPCTACDLSRTRDYLLTDVPANRAALEPLSVQLYNALGEVFRQAGASRRPALVAALVEAERVLVAGKVLNEARCNANAVDLAHSVAPGAVARALRGVRAPTANAEHPWQGEGGRSKKR